jgi:hypothetical protein
MYTNNPSTAMAQSHVRCAVGWDYTGMAMLSLVAAFFSLDTSTKQHYIHLPGKYLGSFTLHIMVDRRHQKIQ